MTVIQRAAAVLLPIAALASTCAPRRARAQAHRFDAEQFHPSIASEGFLAVDGAYVLQHLGWSAGLFATYAHAPLVLRGPSGHVVDGGGLISQQLGMELVGSIGILDRLQIGVGLPFIAYQKTDNRVAELPDGVSAAGLGDLRLELKALVIDRQPAVGHRLGLSVIAGGTIPTGNETGFMGEGNVTGRLRLALEWRFSRLTAALNLGGIFRARRRFDDLYIGNQLVYGAAARVDIVHGLGAIVELAGQVGAGLPASAGDLKTSEAPAELRFGLDLRMRTVLLWLAGGVGLSRGYGVPDGRLIIGLRLRAKDRLPEGERDPDGDGIITRRDRCPEVPGPPENQGCPDADRDHDHIIDRLDGCPDEPGPAENVGCPDRDRDGDGVVDRLDHCPDQAGIANDHGCPPPDRDRDGVPDSQDRCPDRSGPAVNHGCPDVDSDGDGIVDRLDRCPHEAEVWNGLDDEDGCPDPGAAWVVLTATKLELREPIQFSGETALLAPRAKRVLAVVARILELHPEIALVRVEGHTDNQGSAVANLDRSAARASAVRSYLITAQKIDAARIVAQGFGGVRPIADNRGPVGRLKNRRIELVIVERHH
jgi:outer membrane protein OmpA-like peptidoglycan-associated protein